MVKDQEPTSFVFSQCILFLSAQDATPVAIMEFQRNIDMCCDHMGMLWSTRKDIVGLQGDYLIRLRLKLNLRTYLHNYLHNFGN